MNNKIAWCNDFVVAGGAEITNDYIIKNSKYKIDVITPENFNTEYNFYILNNVRRFTKEQLLYIYKNKKYFIFWHDILPNQYQLPLSDIKNLINYSKLNVFLSPLHHHSVEIYYNVLIKNNRYILPFIDVELFKNNKADRPYDNCWIGSVYQHKGIETALLWARDHDTTIDFYGSGDPLCIYHLNESPYANYKGRVNNKELPDIYNKYENFIYMPECIEACGRSVMEAYFCGCNIVKNNSSNHGNIGFMSWNINNKNILKGQINNSFKIFDRYIENAFNI